MYHKNFSLVPHSYENLTRVKLKCPEELTIVCLLTCMHNLNHVKPHDIGYVDSQSRNYEYLSKK